LTDGAIRRRSFDESPPDISARHPQIDARFDWRLIVGRRGGIGGMGQGGLCKNEKKYRDRSSHPAPQSAVVL
jgi:hypothetical protein